MAEDPRKYPPVRATIVDDGWSSPPGVTLEPDLPLPQAPNAVASSPKSESVAVEEPASSQLPESKFSSRPLVVAAPLPGAPRRMGQAESAGAALSPRVVPLGEAFGQEVTCFGVTLRLGVLLLGAVVFAVLGTLGVGRAIVRTPSAPANNALQALPEVSGEPAIASALAPASTQAPTASLAALLSKPKRELSIDEAVSLVEASRAKEVSAAQALARDFLRNPELVNVAQPLKRFKQFASAEPTASVAQLAMAKLPGQVAADLLYEVWTSSAEKNSATTLAQLLLYGKEVLPKASPALRVALDLRAAESCEENHAILPRAIEVGDRRSLHLLALLQRKFGCGPKRKDDCYPCLRVGSELSDALKAVRGRRSPEL
ncbi:MAG: hypothetical protein SFV15_09475 [Polyangiaceae bacterium]|nr:hypothetical protein [Polyangiaceae bacterium]